MRPDCNKLCCEVRGNGLYALEVVGESFYRENLESLLLRKADSLSMLKNGLLTANIECQASLDSNPHNEYDRNAIAVRIDGLLVGHLSRGVAHGLTEQAQRFGYGLISISCKAVIEAYLPEDNDPDRFSVQLDMEELLPEDCIRSHENPRDVLVVDLGNLAGSDPVDFRLDVLPINSNAEYLDVKDGDKFRFWINPGKRYEIRVYAEDAKDPFVSRLVGRVEDKYVLPISRHLNKRLEYETRGCGYSDGRWQIWCRLTPEAEIQAREERGKAMRLAKLRTDLVRPYRPKKPFPMNVASDDTLKKGMRLLIPELRLDDSLTEDQEIATIARSLKSGQEFGLIFAFPFALKVHQMQLASVPTVIEVVKKHRASNRFDIQMLVGESLERKGT